MVEEAGMAIIAEDASRGESLVELEPSPSSTALEFRQPGHVFPLVARPEGVLERAGHTEAAVDLARLAGREPAGVICEIMAPDGTMARLDELTEVARLHGLHLITIADLIAHREVRA